ncbi:hypothetical protein BG015_008564 [Linnemannia schmuckeri]|uniref:Uncharacterized protein n=1 Tax=Linnemannia schmuckeri TaxID=64567 RepID=A0A9P5RX67_9FUNG|nr:hypothetical protein BG015_008564 [Linnemannia schmuckeri]
MQKKKKPFAVEKEITNVVSKYLPHPLATLLNSGEGEFTMVFLVLRLPFVTRLDLGIISVGVLAAVTRICRAVVYSRFSLTDIYARVGPSARRCSEQLCQFFAACSELKECLGDGHIIRAEDLINGPEWTCTGLEKLDVEVVDLPELYVYVSEFQISTQSPGPRFLSNENPETEVWRQQRHAHAVRKQVFSTLARLKNLTEIKFGSDEQTGNTFGYSNLWHKITSLYFSEESGFGEVACLPRLEKLEIWGISPVLLIRHLEGWEWGGTSDVNGVRHAVLYRREWRVLTEIG